jgi:hypothetical protein
MCAGSASYFPVPFAVGDSPTHLPFVKRQVCVSVPSSFHWYAGPSATHPKKFCFKSRASGFVFQADSARLWPFGQ